MLGAGRIDPASGRRHACVGDAVLCGAHGATAIHTGDPGHRIDGRAVARHGDFCTCGCILISLAQVRGRSGLAEDRPMRTD